MLSLWIKEVVIYELTSPFEKNINTQHKYKCDKYAHFETDIKSHKTTVVAYEVGTRGGLSYENIKRLTNMHKQHLNKHIKKKQFLQKIKSLAILSSYYIYTARKHPTWEHTSLINNSFNNINKKYSSQLEVRVMLWAYALALSTLLQPLWNGTFYCSVMY